MPHDRPWRRRLSLDVSKQNVSNFKWEEGETVHGLTSKVLDGQILTEGQGEDELQSAIDDGRRAGWGGDWRVVAAASFRGCKGSN